MSLTPTGLEPVRAVVVRLKLPFQRVLRQGEQWLETEKAARQEAAELKEENESLREEITRLEGELFESQQALEENEALRELVELHEEQPDFSYAEACVLARERSLWHDILTLSAEDSAITPGDCVITGGGALVGIVQQVGEGWCTAITLLDPSFTLGVVVGTAEVPGAAAGTRDGLAAGELEVKDLIAAEAVETDALVRTAGETDTYPKGLILGRVKEVIQEENGLTTRLTLKPEAELEEIERVFVITAD